MSFWKDWISVEEKLPANYDNVLVFDEEEGMQIAKRKKSEWVDELYDEVYDNVTHWTDLPGDPNLYYGYDRVWNEITKRNHPRCNQNILLWTMYREVIGSYNCKTNKYEIPQSISGKRTVPGTTHWTYLPPAPGETGSLGYSSFDYYDEYPGNDWLEMDESASLSESVNNEPHFIENAIIRLITGENVSDVYLDNFRIDAGRIDQVAVVNDRLNLTDSGGNTISTELLSDDDLDDLFYAVRDALYKIIDKSEI